MTRRTEAIEPLVPRHLQFYACGPTVYSYAHIGNFRSFLTADLVLRTARALGWTTSYVTNITDVGHLTEDDVADAGGEDRMEKALRSEKGRRFANVWDLARYFADVLLEDWRALNLREPDVRPRATEHVTQQIKAVERLIEKGHAYETRKGVYFSVKTYPEYGKLSGNTLDNQLEAGARETVQDADKRDPRDFALWKKDPGHLMQWHSPWGWGFPGWHIECSTMSQEYLGESFDMHTGGEDNTFPHHDCEIAQAESLTGKPFARYWLHTRFLQVEGEKMSKSAGNFLTVRQLIEAESEGGRGIHLLALRLALISGQYRKPFNFTFDQLRASAKHVQRFEEAVALVENALQEHASGETGSGDGPSSGSRTGGGRGGDRPSSDGRNGEGPSGGDGAGEDRLGARLEVLYERALDAMLDDLNTPEAIAASIEGAKLIQGFGSGLNAASAQSAKAWLERINDLLGIVRHDISGDDPDAEDPLAIEVERLLEERDAARANRDFGRADEIRVRLAEMDIEVMDTPEGTKWRRKVAI